MALERDVSKGVSLRSKDQIESGGIFGPGPAKIVKSEFADFTYVYKDKRKVVAPAWCVTFDRDGEEEVIPYTVGSGWKIAPGGEELIPRNGQTGLPNNSNAAIFIASLEAAGMPEDFMTRPQDLEGVEVILIAKPIERDFRDDLPERRKGRDEQESTKRRPKALLVVQEEDGITVAPWLDDKPAAKGKASASSSKKAKDGDEDDKPVKSAKGGKPNGKMKDEDDEALKEEATEALIDALTAEDGPIDIDDLENTINALKSLKKHAHREEIAALCADSDFLDTENGWTVNTKKGIVELGS